MVGEQWTCPPSLSPFYFPLLKIYIETCLFSVHIINGHLLTFDVTRFFFLILKRKKHVRVFCLLVWLMHNSLSMTRKCGCRYEEGGGRVVREDVSLHMTHRYTSVESTGREGRGKVRHCVFLLCLFCFFLRFRSKRVYQN